MGTGDWRRDIRHLKILQHGVGVGVSFRAVEEQAAPDDQVQSRQFAQFTGANVFAGLGRQPPGAQRGQRFQSGGAREHFEQYDPQRVEVGTGIGWKPRQLLRRHVARGATAFSDSAEAEILGQARAGQAEIAEQHGAVGADEEITGLEIPMDDVGCVNGAQSLTDLNGEGACLRGRKTVYPAQQIGQAFAFHPIHGDQGPAVHLADVMHADHVFVADPGCQHEFSFEPQQVAQVGHQLGAQ